MAMAWHRAMAAGGLATGRHMLVMILKVAKLQEALDHS